LSSITFVDLRPTANDLQQLSSFYQTLYVSEFPDPDERESLGNMRGYLAHDGANGNAYIVALVYDEATIIGGAVCDYFLRSSCGAIEFLTIAPRARGRGLGAELTRHVERRMTAAAEERDRSLAFVMAEMNDPFKRPSTPDNLDPFRRLMFWDRLGYRRTCFPYVQPALSAEQSAVANLLLAAKPYSTDRATEVASATVTAFLRDYLIYAMRFEDPETSPEFVAMKSFLSGREVIELGALNSYIAELPPGGLSIDEIHDPGDPDFEPVMELYARAFPDAAVRVDRNAFVALLRGDASARYHLWALRAGDAQSVAGMSSFFAFDGFGFGGYLAFEPPLRGSGQLRALLSRIERTLVAESAAYGWYVECANSSAAAVFVRCGFFEVALSYRQPRIGAAPTRRLHLLYKECGASFTPPTLSREAFIAAMRAIATSVYGLDESSAAFAAFVARACDCPDPIPFVT
jgi:GNAT superfamily N-acetyltransferase